MNRKDLEAVANSIFNEVKLKVIANIKCKLDDILEKYDEDYEECLLAEDNYNRIIDYYDDEYLMKLILNNLENETLLEIEDESCLINEVAESVSDNITEIGYPKFLHSQDFCELVRIECGWYDNNPNNDIDEYFYVQLAYKDIYYHWMIEKGYLLEIECKECGEQYDEYECFNDYIETKKFKKFLNNHIITTTNNARNLLSVQYPHLQKLF